MANKYYFKNYPGFRVSSGVKITTGGDKGRTTDWVTVTDNGQGIGFFTSGLSRIRTNGTSLDLCGFNVKEGEPAKIIQAANGHIIIDAQAGDIVLKGRNVRIQADAHDGEVTIISTKHFYVKAAICSINGTKINILGDQDLKCIASNVETVGGISNNSSNMIDELKGGNFLTKILKIFTDAKKFLEENLGF